MGVASSRGVNNIQLVDNLVTIESVESPSVELVFRVIDRGLFVPNDPIAQETIYNNGPWRASDEIETKYGPFHLSSPSIYATVLEHLDLQPGQSFLNIGSGLGYFSSMAGLYLGSSGVSHGVEINKKCYDWSIQKQKEILRSTVPMCFDWCVPKFFHGTCFKMKLSMKYDRIYVGAKVPVGMRMHFVKMLKVGGVCIMPYGSTFQRIHRSTERTFLAYEISSVEFSSLITLTDQSETKEIELPNDLSPKSLFEMCQTKIREYIRLHQKEDILIRQKTEPDEEKTVRYPLDPVEDEMLGETHDLRGSGTNEQRTNPERDDEGFTIYNLQSIRPPERHIVELNFARESDDEDEEVVDQRGMDIRDGVAAVHVQARNTLQIDLQNAFEEMLHRVANAVRTRAAEFNREIRNLNNPDNEASSSNARPEVPPRSQSAPLQADNPRSFNRRHIREHLGRVIEREQMLREAAAARSNNNAETLGRALDRERLSRVRETPTSSNVEHLGRIIERERMLRGGQETSGSSNASTASSSSSPSNITRKRKAPSEETLSEEVFKRAHTFPAPEPFKRSYIRMLPIASNENSENTPPSQTIQEDTMEMFDAGVRKCIRTLNLPPKAISQLLFKDITEKKCDEPREKDDPME